MVSHKEAAVGTVTRIAGSVIVAILLIAVVAAVIINMSNNDAAKAASKPSGKATVTVTKNVLVAAPTPTPAPVKAARGVKPLQELTAGDRVLYADIPGERRQLCKWVLWNGSIDSAVINCGKGTFPVKTGFLTPVEPNP